jgi:hypothetical protein
MDNKEEDFTSLSILDKLQHKVYTEMKIKNAWLKFI